MVVNRAALRPKNICKLVNGIKLKLFLISIVFFSFSAFAGQVTQGGLKVTKVMAGYDGGEVYFLVDRAPLNPKECASTTSSYYVLGVDPLKSNTDQVISVLLTALLTGKQVEIQVYDDDCLNQHAVIRRVAIY